MAGLRKRLAIVSYRFCQPEPVKFLAAVRLLCCLPTEPERHVQHLISCANFRGISPVIVVIVAIIRGFLLLWRVVTAGIFMSGPVDHALKVNNDHRLIPDDPGIVPWRDA